MQRKRNVVLQDWDDFAPLDNFSHDSLVSLLRYYIKDCFVLNSFNLLNKRKDLALGYSEHITDSVEYIETWVENTAINTTVLKL